jgi:DUF218 domain-containing protein
VIQVHAKRRTFGPIMLVVLLFVFALNAGTILVVDKPERADVILVLAGETDRRPARALQLLSQGYGGRVVIDVPAAARIYDMSQVEVAEKYVQKLGQHNFVSICPIEGLSTKDESREAEKCIEKQHATRVLIVTSDFHTRRALSIFRHQIPSWTFSTAAAYDETQFGTRWWMHRQWAKTCFEEWLRLIWWNAVDRWR